MNHKIILALVNVAAFAATALWVQGVVSPRGIQDVVRARRIELLDSGGRLRAVLEVRDDLCGGWPSLTLNTDEGGFAFYLALDGSGHSTLAFDSATTEGRVGLGFLNNSDVVGLCGPTEEDREMSGYGLFAQSANTMRKLYIGYTNNGAEYATYPGLLAEK